MSTNCVCHHPPMPSFSTLRVECMRREFEARRQAVLDKIIFAEVEKEKMSNDYNRA